MEIHELADKIIRIPSESRKRTDISFRELLECSGYHSAADAVTDHVLLEAIQRRAGMVEEWLFWSQDKRNSSGWYFLSNSDREYVVGFYPPRTDDRTVHFTDANLACANYIYREITELTVSAG